MFEFGPRKSGGTLILTGEDTYHPGQDLKERNPTDLQVFRPRKVFMVPDTTLRAQGKWRAAHDLALTWVNLPSLGGG